MMVNSRKACGLKKKMLPFQVINFSHRNGLTKCFACLYSLCNVVFLLPELLKVLCWQQSELPLECNFKQVVYKTLGRCNCISFQADYIA